MFENIKCILQPGFGGSPEGANQTGKHSFSSLQLQQLRGQIMAYRLLARNQPLSQQLAMAVQGKRFDPPLTQQSGPPGPAQTPPSGPAFNHQQRATTQAEPGNVKLL